MEKSVQVMSISTIPPATYQASTIPQRIDLTPWDLLSLLGTPMQPGFLFDSNMVLEFLQRLKVSLSRTLDYFYPLAGRLRCIKDVSKDSTMFYIECNNTGVEFIHVVANGITMADVLQQVYDPSVMDLLFPRNGLVNVECDDSKPFLAVQVTELTNGGYFLGCTFSHVFCDGSSLWHFLNSWSEICRGFDSPQNLPVLERFYPLGRTDIWIANKLIILPPSYELIQANMLTCKRKILILTKEKVALLKQKAIEETKNPKISSLQAMLGFLIVFISRYQRVLDNNDFTITMPIGARKRIKPPLSDHYLGNASYPARTTITYEDLNARDALRQATLKVHDLVAIQSETTAMNFLTSWVENPIFSRPTKNKCTGIVMGNSPVFNLYGNDFGRGKPMVVRSGATGHTDGMVIFFEGAESGSVHMELFLSSDTFELLEKDTEYMNLFQI